MSQVRHQMRVRVREFQIDLPVQGRGLQITLLPALERHQMLLLEQPLGPQITLLLLERGRDFQIDRPLLVRELRIGQCLVVLHQMHRVPVQPQMHL